MKTVFEVEQNGIIFHLITDIINNNTIQMLLIEKNTETPCIYKGLYTLSDLKNISPNFQNIYNIEKAAKMINDNIENGKISIDYANKSIDLLLFVNDKGSYINLNLIQNKNGNNASNLLKNPTIFQTIYPPPYGNHNNNKYSLNSPKSKSRYDLTLILSQKEDNNNLYSTPIKDYFNTQNQNSPTTNYDSNNPSPNINEVNEFMNNNKQLINENTILKNKINELKNELELEKQKTKQINDQIIKENTSLKNKIIHLENSKSSSIQNLNLDLVKGYIIRNNEELELLCEKICVNHSRISLNLIYKATSDSDEAQAFHYKCDSAEKTLVLVQTKNGKRFGGYTSCNWSGDNEEKYDNYAFIFSLDTLKIYDIIQGEKAIGCYPNFGPVFLGCQIKINNNFFTNGGTTYLKGINYDTEEDYELSGGEEQYQVQDIEVYEVILG